jgi:translocation and assembly module TamB
MSDKDNIIYGTDANMTLGIKDNTLIIDNYFFNLYGRDFFSHKKSFITYDKNSTLYIEKLWVNDGIKIDGNYTMDTDTLNLNANAKNYHYKDRDGESDIDLHVNILHDTNGSVVEGEVELKNSFITYKPVSTGIVNDDDIILISDVKAPKKSPLFLNIRIFSQEKLHYKTQDVDVEFIPDVTIYKESKKDIELLGWVVTKQGLVYNSSSEYEIKESEIYFGGGVINPFLHLHLYYEIDDKEIDIYVTNTLASPVMLFTSNPPMSQSDIISYLLFGTPANSSFDDDGSGSNGLNAANMILGTGLKQMIGDTTGIRVDTINLLSKKDGGLGFEVGTRLNKDVRLVLKNDDIFSMVLQLSLTRSVRLDVDVKETGQGVNIIYVKDYRDIFK